MRRHRKARTGGHCCRAIASLRQRREGRPMTPLSVLAVAIGLLLAALQPASAGDAAAHYPDKVVRLLVPFPPGGAVDVVARAVAMRLSEQWKQPVVVDNKPGASGAIAA